MANPIPSQLALTIMSNGQTADATPVANDFSAIQAAVNSLIVALSGGTNGQRLTAVDGSDVQWSTVPAPTRQILTAASGTYTTPTGCRAILVEGVGGGGSGGGVSFLANDAAAGGGGAGGAYAAKLVQTPSATYPYAVGAGGAAPVAGNNPGNTGADTTFGTTGSVITAKGGPGGGGMAATGSFPTTSAAPGTPAAAGSSVGDLIVPGNQGIWGYIGSNSVGFGSPGGDAAGPYGGKGGRQIPVSTRADGNPGTQYGAGGSGGVTNSGGVANQTGGAGANGIIVVTEFY